MTARVAIVGAGLAGLIAARDLVRHGTPDGGRGVVVVERSGVVGGRLATRSIGDAVFDHGAQFFTVRTDELAADVDRWTAAGVVEEWCRGFAEVDGYPRYRIAGGMANLATHLAGELVASGVTLTTGVGVVEIRPGDNGDGWLVRSGDDGVVVADAVILTPPVPLSSALLDAGGVARAAGADAFDDFAYHQVVALLAVLDRSPGLPEPGALQQADDDTFSFVSDNQAKGISPVPAVTFHTAHGRSAALWSATDDEVLDALLPAARDVVAPATISQIEVVRWPHTGPVAAHPDRCAVVAEGPSGPIVLAGDGFGGSKVEGAYSSGRAAAALVADALSLG